jgi:hypothetical protein
MSSDMVTVYSTNKLYEAEIVRQILGDHGINSFLLNKMDSAYQFGDIEIHVPGEDIMRSKLLIQEFEDQ